MNNHMHVIGWFGRFLELLLEFLKIQKTEEKRRKGKERKECNDKRAVLFVLIILFYAGLTSYPSFTFHPTVPLAGSLTGCTIQLSGHE